MRIKIRKIAAASGGAEARAWGDHVPGAENDDGKSLPVEYEIEGELAFPIKVGQCVRVARDRRNGVPATGMFITSPVVEVSTHGFRTKNSVYITGESNV